MDERKMTEVEALAGNLGNVIEACRRCGVSRSLFYKWLKSRPDAGPNVRRRHPHALPDGLPARVLGLAAEYPEWGCDRISHYLKLKGAMMSPTTIQKILTRNGLRTREEREEARRSKGLPV